MKTYWKHSLAILSMLFAGAVVTTVQAQEREGGDRPEAREGDRRGPREGGPREGGPRPGGDRQFNPEQMIERIMRLDENNDGKVSKDEVGEGRMQGIFDRADADSDGFLTKEELKEMFSRRPGGDRPGPGREGDRPGPRPGMGPGPGMGMGPGPGMMMMPFVMERLELSEEQRRELRALHEETQKKMMGILNEEQRKQLKEMMENRPGPRGDRPEAREGDRRGPRDGDRGPRGPRDGDRPRGDRERGDRDGDI